MRTFGESSIVADLADGAARRVTRKAISALQRISCKLSGDDSELKTLWDEICVQRQFESAFSWDVYEQIVEVHVSDLVSGLPDHERAAIWLQTAAGLEWQFAEPEDRKADPVDDANVVQHIIRHYIYDEAERWSNAKIRTFLDRH
jgi:hypothetical protein